MLLEQVGRTPTRQDLKTDSRQEASAVCVPDGVEVDRRS
jgi:hypothetical protein